MRIAIVLAAVLACSAADAQIAAERYYPLRPGDVRVYEYRSGFGTTTCPAELAGYERNEVLRDTVVSGEPHSVASCTSFSPAGVQTGRNVYVVQRSGRLSVDGAVLSENGGCALLSGFESGQTSEEMDATVTIGGTSYVVAGQFASFGSGSGSGGTTSSFYTNAYADIGPGRQSSESQRLSPPACTRSERELVYADVSGQAYGANPVSSDGAPPAGTGLALTASPSPASAATTLRLASGTRRDVRVEAFDLLGRRVFAADARPGALRLDVSAWPAGLYLVRAAADGDAVTARLVVSR